jgi:hypothetical protein
MRYTNEATISYRTYHLIITFPEGMTIENVLNQIGDVVKYPVPVTRTRSEDIRMRNKDYQLQDGDVILLGSYAHPCLIKEHDEDKREGESMTPTD